MMMIMKRDRNRWSRHKWKSKGEKREAKEKERDGERKLYTEKKHIKKKEKFFNLNKCLICIYEHVF